jgi:hypothetical protein
MRKIALCAALTLIVCPAFADDGLDKKLSYGVGLRAAWGVAAQSGSDAELGVSGLDVRPYISGQIYQWLKFAGNLDLNGGNGTNVFSHIDVLDAVAQFEPSQIFNVWMGRFLPPTDRANLSGPYYQNDYYYPGTVNGYPSIYAGRADGAAIWGQVNGGQFKYQAGAFSTGGPAPFADLIYGARLTMNFLDPEPGYYNASTYYGSKDVLALGAVIQYQKLPDTAAATDNKLVAFNLDLLFEKRLGGGNTVTLEGAYYNFDSGSGTGKQGTSFFALASYLFGGKIGPGRIQPLARVQDFTPSGGGSSTLTIDGGLNYILDAFNARGGILIANTSPPGVPAVTTGQLVIQIQE